MKNESTAQRLITHPRRGFRFQVSGFKSQALSCKGFTLVELLAVITIIMILAGLVLGGAAWAGRKADISRCQARMQTIKNALEEYKLDYGKYPPQGVGAAPFAALFTTPNSSGRPGGEKRPYLTETNFINTSSQLIDPWGNYFRYQAPGARNKSTYDLWSYGPNGKDESASTTGSDDLNNWASGH
jgi:general secretion pathway protein G